VAQGRPSLNSTAYAIRLLGLLGKCDVVDRLASPLVGYLHEFDGRYGFAPGLTLNAFGVHYAVEIVHRIKEHLSDVQSAHFLDQAEVALQKLREPNVDWLYSGFSPDLPPGTMEGFLREARWPQILLFQRARRELEQADADGQLLAPSFEDVWEELLAALPEARTREALLHYYPKPDAPPRPGDELDENELDRLLRTYRVLREAKRRARTQCQAVRVEEHTRECERYLLGHLRRRITPKALNIPVEQLQIRTFVARLPRIKQAIYDARLSPVERKVMAWAVNSMLEAMRAEFAMHIGKSPTGTEFLESYSMHKLRSELEGLLKG